MQMINSDTRGARRQWGAAARVHLGPWFGVLFVSHFASTRKVELGKIGCDGSEKIRFDFENSGKDSVELALIRVPLVDDIEQSSGGVRR